MTKSWCRGARALAVIVCLSLGTVGTARAQNTAAAESEFRNGKDKMRAGKIAEACEHFQSSQRLEPNLSTLMSLADCREKNGQYASAWGAWIQVKTETRGDAAAAKQHEIAIARAKALEGRLSYLTINVPDDSRVAGLEIRRNDELVDPAVWNRAIPVDGGDHRIEGKAPGHESWSTTVTVQPEQDRGSVEVPKFKELEKVIETPEGPTTIHETVVIDEPSPMTPRRWVAVGVAGGGLIAIAAGSVLGFQAQTLRDDAETRCPPDACSPGDADEANRLNDRAQTRELFANIGFGIGAAAVIAGGVLWFLGAPEEPDRTGEVSVTPALGPGVVGAAATVRF
jgi:hypothetical protein